MKRLCFIFGVFVPVAGLLCTGFRIEAQDRMSRPISPQTAGRIAFVGQQSSVNHIFIMDVEGSGMGSNPIRLTSDTEAESYPFWSPDGKRFVYQRAFNGSAIYVINADGAGQQRLSPTPGFDVSPFWSPDGTQIVYARLHSAPAPGQPPPMTDIRIMNADGSGDHAVLANTVFSVEPQWSVNGQLVFMSYLSNSDLQIYTMNVDGTGLRQLTFTGSTGNNGDPVWSPDGTQITFGSDREGGGKLNVFTMNADGSQVRQLTHFDVPYEAGNPNWSSDGKKISFQYDINGMKQSDPNAYAEVWIMNPDGSGETATGVPCSDVGCDPTWQPRVCPERKRPLGVGPSPDLAVCSGPEAYAKRNESAVRRMLVTK
jgi:Tol biopolymer transport system component